MGVAEVIGENGWMFGGPEQHLGIVGASALELGGPMGKVDSERWLDGGRSSLERELSRSCVPADWSCVELYDDGSCGGVGAVPQSPSTHSKAHGSTLPPAWACTIICRRS